MCHHTSVSLSELHAGIMQYQLILSHRALPKSTSQLCLRLEMSRLERVHLTLACALSHRERHRDKRWREEDTSERQRKRDEDAAAAEVAARDDAAREREARDLDSEAEKRRKRIEAWQAMQRQKTGPSATAGPSAADAPADGAASPPQQKKWSFEDEDSDEEEQQQPAEAVPAASTAPPPPGAAAAAASKDEVDPLDAFMADNDEQAQQEAAQIGGGRSRGSQSGGGRSRGRSGCAGSRHRSRRRR